MSKASVKIVEPSNRPRSLEGQHMSGEHIARTEIAPFITHLIKKHNLSKIELASALISLAYALLRKDQTPGKANAMFRHLASKTQRLTDFKKNSKIQ